jgi:hypothetical protein
MAYKLEDIIAFIETESNIKLYEYQKTILKSIVEGNKFSCPVHSGRKMLVNGYCNYIKGLHAKHLSYDEAAVHVALQDAMKENTQSFKIEDDVINFKQEYECKWEE